MIDISSLTTPVTSDQLLQGWLDSLETLGVPANSWPKGGVARTILAVFALTIAQFSLFVSQLVNGGFLPTATGNWLTILAQYFYGVTRVVATQATGQVTLTNTGGGSFPELAGSVTVQNATTKATYTLDAFTLGPGGTVTVNCTCTAFGTGGNATPGQISTLVTNLPGVTVTNAAAVVGVDDQTDDALRAVCFASLGAISPNGPSGAYFYAISVAKNSSGAPVNINRISIPPFSATTSFTIYVASPSGAPSASDVIAAQASVQAIAEPDLITATLIPATPVPIAPAGIVVWAQTRVGLDPVALANSVASALATYASTFPIGGLKKSTNPQAYIYASALDGVAKAVDPGIFAVDGFVDIPLSAGQVPQLSAAVTARLVTGA